MDMDDLWLTKTTQYACYTPFPAPINLKFLPARKLQKLCVQLHLYETAYRQNWIAGDPQVSLWIIDYGYMCSLKMRSLIILVTSVYAALFFIGLIQHHSKIATCVLIVICSRTCIRMHLLPLQMSILHVN